MDFAAVRALVGATLALVMLTAGCEQKWNTAKDPVQDEELDTAFFAGLDPKEIPDVPEPKGLRPCCILGNDIGAEVGSIPVPRSSGICFSSRRARGLLPGGGNRPRASVW